MRNFLLSTLAITGFFHLLSAQQQSETTYTVCSRFGITPPLRELQAQQQKTDEQQREAYTFSNQFNRNIKVNQQSLPAGPDPLRQSESGSRAAVPLLQSWNGRNGVQPPDPSGAAGPFHYVQAVNVQYMVYNKQGLNIFGPFDLSSLWPGSSDDGDPIVMYDRFADRWVITQFQGGFFGGNKILFAVSQTEDPTGAFYTYEFDFNQFHDYPKYSIWHDGYYISSNVSSQNAAVVDRTKMLAGDPTAGMITKNFPSLQNDGFFCPLPADADGDLPLAGDPMYYFHYEDDNWSNVSTDRIKIYKFATNWANPSATTLTLHQTLTVSPFDTDFGQTWDNIRQPGTNQKLDAITGVFMYRAPYRRWTTHNSVLLNHVVDVDGNDLAGIRWYELRENNGSWSLYQEGTYAPDNINRWMASMAMDNDGNIGMAYSLSGGTTFPSLGYTGRWHNDPPGEMTMEEGRAVTGNGYQSGTERYGDYAHMSLDPDGYTFWYTGQYMQSNNQQRTRIFSYSLRQEVGINTPSVRNIRLNTFIREGNQLQLQASGLFSREPMQVDLIDMQGRTIRHEEGILADKDWNYSMNISNISRGTYFVRLGNAAFQKVARIVF